MSHDPHYSDLVDENGDSNIRICTSLAHPNRKFYKCYWRIFHRQSEFEGRAFFKTPVLCTHDAQKLMGSLKERGEGFLVYASKIPRQGNTPFDFSHPRWADVTPAPSYDDDTDPEWDGHR